MGQGERRKVSKEWSRRGRGKPLESLESSSAEEDATVAVMRVSQRLG